MSDSVADSKYRLNWATTLPRDLLDVGADLLADDHIVAFDGIPTSIDNMTPGNPFLETLAETPLAPGVDARDPSGELPDETEFNLTVDYKRESGALRNAWFRIRWSSVKFDGVGKWRNELRIILNYRFSIL